MKKIVLLAVMSTFLFGGEINDRFQEINNIKNPIERVEKKLDLILELEYLQPERDAEARAQAVDDAVESTKSTMKKGAVWLSDQLNSESEEEAKDK